jgi:dicarboxylate/amino acid:cation (Na+ or H+) symporter, DAACS family
LMFELGATGGFAALRPLGWYVGVVLAALAVQLQVIYPLALRWFVGRSPRSFFRGARPALAVAFSTASSAATLPTSLQVAERDLGIPAETARFVLTVGATANQNGTALFEGVTVLFLAQLYGVDLTAAQAALVCGVAVLGGVGTAGVPGGALPVIAATLGVVGVPPEAVGVIVGVDRLLDMCRTTVNVAGDLVIAEIVTGRR